MERTGLQRIHDRKLLRRGFQNLIAVVGTSGLGASYFLIHIYVTPLKRFLQALFAMGCLGGLYLMLSQACFPARRIQLLHLMHCCLISKTVNGVASWTLV